MQLWILRIDMGIRYNKHHGGSGKVPEKLYKVWTALRCRCYNVNDASYKNYGGRGIFVSEEWLDDYAAFRTWCLSNGYQVGLTIDRIDNDGPYAPHNCRFVTRKVQNNNQRKKHKMLTVDGVTKPLKEWAAQAGFDPKVLNSRILRGWSAKDAVTRERSNRGYTR